MISDKQRNEVAARLRSKKPEEFTFPFGKTVFTHIFRSVFPNQMPLTNWILQVPYRLADLIDRPTCRNVSGYQDAFECSECGYKIGLIADIRNEHGELLHIPLMPSSCTNCEAEVVE